MSEKIAKRRNLSLWIRSSLLIATIPVAVVPFGCNRAHYRNKADREVCELIQEKVEDATAPAIPSVQMSPQSRMFDPFNPDRPPMPEDDEVSHQYMLSRILI